MDGPLYRATFTLSAELAVEIAQVARILGVSQSALVEHVLGGPLGKLALDLSLRMTPGAGVESVPPKRRRGRSSGLTDEIIEAALAATRDPRELGF
jgi:hypothetical protein